VLYNGTWGAICDDSWDIKDSRVVCRRLGFSDALSAPCCSPFGSDKSKKRFWLDDVRCQGNETDIGECAHSVWGNHDCNYRNQAGVVCTPHNSTNGKMSKKIIIKQKRKRNKKQEIP
jgi:deleted-in-malignant-brain-tumors protein 1